jgi:hypothetical protein
MPPDLVGQVRDPSERFVLIGVDPDRPQGCVELFRATQGRVEVPKPEAPAAV